MQASKNWVDRVLAKMAERRDLKAKVAALKERIKNEPWIATTLVLSTIWRYYILNNYSNTNKPKSISSKYYQEAIELNPNSHQAHNGLALLLWNNFMEYEQAKNLLLTTSGIMRLSAKLNMRVSFMVVN